MVNPPFAQPKLPLQVTLRGDTELLEIFELLLEDEVLAITHPIDTHTPELILLMEDAAWPALSARLQKIADDRGEAFTAMTGLLRDIDWVSKVQKDFPAFRMGRFYIYAAHDAAPIPKNSLPLHIEAASAFGTGEHDTTSGCLLALELESKIRPRPRRVMDMGCGTAILAMAAARLWPFARIRAFDNDAGAVRTARENLRVNRMRQVWVGQSNGYGYRIVRGAKSQVIVANILARPLMKMARSAAQSLAPEGTLILSGLLRHQERMVLFAHRHHGLKLKSRLRRGRWSVLILR
ncbi:MAG: 50S ribosomal protein L11 methyltransferase [Alphaproteobacteria bacterium]